MAFFEGLSAWEAVKATVKWFVGIITEAWRRRKLKREKREKGMKTKDEGMAESDPRKMMQSILDIKKAKDKEID